MIIGIDLGTTNSAVAYLGPDGPKLIPNALGHYLTPSVVAIDEKGIALVGQAAKEHQVLHPNSCSSCFKRQMGTDWTVQLGSTSFTPVQLSSLVLGSLKEDAESHLNCDITRAVITVPAYFHDGQRQATIEAGKMAGLTVERIINEPTAAAMAYGIHEKEADKTVVVFDLGGGTFDISIVDFFEGCIEVRASAGEAVLGGEDFTRAIARTILADRSVMYETAELKTPAMVSRLVQQCEKAKRALSQSDTAELLLPDAKGDLNPDGDKLVIDREFLIRACKPLMQKIETPIRRAMGDAKLTTQDINEVIMVGGATRTPAIFSMARQAFKQDPKSELNPDHVVGLGAAIQAGLIGNNKAVEDVVVVDVAPFTLGVEISKEMGSEYRQGYFFPVINRNTVIPISRSHVLSTVSPNQEQINIRVYQGEGRRVSENLLLGDLKVKGIPKGPAGQEIEVRFTYDNNGVLEVETTVVKTQQKKSIVLTKHVTNMNEKEIKRAVNAMQKLKIHPREVVVNRFVLKRAERVFQELPSMLRDQLGQLIDYFEHSLDSQEPADIEVARNALEMFLSANDATDLEPDDDNFAM